MAHDQHLLWTTKGSKASKKDPNLDPYSLYDFFNNANAARLRQGGPIQRIKSAAPRIGPRQVGSKNRVTGSPLGSHVSLRNPSPTPATSRPLSSRSGRSSLSSFHKSKPEPSTSPTSLYLGLHKARCKSAPPRPVDYYLPQKPKIGKSCVGSAALSSRSAPKRAWQNRISSAKSQHSLLSREEVEKRDKERCKSAPLPYDFSAIEVVNSVPEHGSDIQRLKAFTRPLTCMPDVIQNVLSHSGLRHCCSAYQPRPKSSSCSRQQFWPVARPAVFHRGDVPKYLHFVKPAGFWIRGAEIHPRTGNDEDLSVLDDHQDVLARTDFPLYGDDDVEETVLYEEQFIIPATPSEASLSDREYSPEQDEGTQAEEEDLDASPVEDLVDKYLDEGEGELKKDDHSNNHVKPDVATPEPKEREREPDDKTPEPVEQVFEIIITKLEPHPDQTPSLEEEQTEVMNEEPVDDLQIVVPELPQWAAKGEEEENVDDSQEQKVVPEPAEESVYVEVEPWPVKEEEKEEEEKPGPEEVPKKSEVQELKMQTHQVKFSDSLILTSFKSPPPKEEKREQLPIKPILKPATSKIESLPLRPEESKVIPTPQKRVTPAVERKDAPPLVKPLPMMPVKVVDDIKTEKKDEKKQSEEAKMAEEKTQEPPKLEPEILPKPEYIRAPGAYRMYDPKDLLEYRLEQKRESFKPVKSSLTSTKMPFFVPSAESTEVMTSVLDAQKQRREGMKPWLQGRLALSQQTSRFELPMDVKLLADMTPMEYLTKYCIISTRRKALYKHIFQKVDKDRDNLITFKEMDRALKEIHVDYISTEQVKKLIEMVEGHEKSTFNLAQFSAIAAFSERLLFSETQITEKNNVYSSKEIIEEADFCGLKFKLSGFPVNPTVRKILEVL